MASRRSQGLEVPAAGVAIRRERPRPPKRHPRWSRIRSFARRREALFGAAVVLGVTGVSLALSMQGWRSRIPSFDLITYHYGIREFLETGVVLRHGDTGSYGSYKPPGTSWLMLPGVLLFGDPRLTDYVGTGLLHLSTIAGLYLLARRLFGTTTAAVAVVLYGLSQHGLFLAGSLWPNGRPDFFVWTVFFAVLWATRGAARYLAISLLILGLGMYVDLALLPVLVVYPVLWLVYRPPVRPLPLVAAGAVVLAVWMPYLRFEYARDFIDIRSQVFQQSVELSDFRSAWCDPTRTLLRWQGDGSQTAPAGPIADAGPSFVDRLREPVDGALSNFQSPVPLAAIVLFLLTAVGLLLASVPGATGGRDEQLEGRLSWRHPVVRTAGAMVLSALALGAILVLAELVGFDPIRRGTAGILLRRLQPLLAAGGLAVIGAYVAARSANRALVRRSIHVQTRESARDARALVICLLIPWLLLLLVAEPGKPERFMWLWTLQSVFLAAAVVHVLPRLGAPRIVAVVATFVVVFLVVNNGQLTGRVDDWIRDGWSGVDSPEVRVVNVVADDVRAQGRDEAAVGYHMYVYPFMPGYHITNPLYKVGAELDLMLQLREGIRNTDRCAEGLRPDDDYRIVETTPQPSPAAPRNYFAADLPDGARLLAEIGRYRVYRIDAAG